jgi:ABC-type cobalamin/Fe3+-siderophores transport system ATPase subunit
MNRIDLRPKTVLGGVLTSNGPSVPATVSLAAGIVKLSNSFEISFESEQTGYARLFELGNESPAFAFVRSPSGTGKTTLLRLFYSYLRQRPLPLGTTLSFQLQPNDQAVLPRAVGFVTQDPPKLSHWRVSDLLPHSSAYLQAFFPSDWADLYGRRLGELSGGQRKRVFIASVVEGLARRAEKLAFLLLDETLDGLGVVGAEACLRAIASVWSLSSDRPLYVLVVTHLDDTGFLVGMRAARISLGVVSDSSTQLRVALGAR